jgi:TonB-dependent receptor
MQKIYFIALILLSTLSISAQVGTIKGQIKDEKTGEGIIGGNVVIEGTTIGASTDVEGNYVIPKVKAGKYNIVVTYVSYKTKTIKGLEVYPDQTTVLNTSIQEDAMELESVVITTQRQTDTEISVITELKKADLVAVGISSQQIKLSQDRDAAQVIKRIPGVTILNNRFVNVRGLSERYSTVMLNGVIAPSTEVDTKAFAFDLIPSNMIDRMLVYKSGSAELPGEFAGANIVIQTKSVIDENSFSVNLTSGFRAATTFGDFKTYEGSRTDFLGFDNGKRQLSSAFPSENLRVYSQDLSNSNNVRVLKNAAASLPNIWNTNSSKASPDYRLTVNFSRSIALGGGKKLGNVSSISYSNTKQRIEQLNGYYDQFIPSLGKSDRRYKFNDIRDMENVRIGIISNFLFEFNPKNRIEFRNLFNQQGLSQVTTRTGLEGVVDAQSQEVNNLSLNYFGRGIYSGQLQGLHSFSDKLNLTWVLGYSSINANQPDYRRIRSQRLNGTNDPFQIVIPPGASTLDAGRFYSDLNEKVYTQSLNIDYKLKTDLPEDQQGKISFGYYVSQTNRDFSARWMSYRWFNSSNVNLSILEQPFETLFTEANVNPAEGTNPLFVLEEGTNFSDKYTGKNLLTAGYTSLTLPFAQKFRLSTGLRLEYNRQQLDSFDDKDKALTVNNPVTSLLPSLNLSYNLSEKNIFRIAYSRTINRPVFRELAPFNYYDFDRNSNSYGNPNLKVADIDNIDLKWENYPSKSENFSVGVFYKKFTNPIESELIGGSNLIYTFRNAPSAYSYGLEADARKSLDNISSNAFIQKLSFVFNGALIFSEVDLGNVTNQEKKRPMQGQSPYVINAGLYYNNQNNGLQVNASYNVFGPRIFAVGDLVQNATQYEMPRHQLDLTISKDINEHWEIKAGVQDILNQYYRILQDSNRDNKIDDSVDEPIIKYTPGQYVSVGISYKM